MDNVYITLVNGFRPIISCKGDDIEPYIKNDLSFGWSSILVDEIKNFSPNGSKNLVFKIPINKKILTSNVYGTNFMVLSDYEVCNVLDTENYGFSYKLENSDVKIKDDVYMNAIEVKYDSSSSYYDEDINSSSSE